MVDRPILFSAPMVRALLAGTKTQTRRVVKAPVPEGAVDAGVISSGSDSNGLWWWLDSTELEWASPIGHEFRCPYGVPGDRLWVKETWQAQEAFDNLSPSAIGTTFEEELGGPDACPIRYVADGKCEGSVDLWQQSLTGKTRVSIHMPRWASRLTLKITEVRVERLNKITTTDAKAEGWDGSDLPLGWYADLWESINGPGSWAANPWVWAVSFEVVQ